LKHGYRWRYRDQWLLLSGEGLLLDKLVPGLRTNGYLVKDGVVLVYSGSDQPNHEWVKQIGRTRRSRPIDAMVTVVSDIQADGEGLDADALTNRISVIQQTLGFSAPAYVLNAVEVSGSVPEVIDPVFSAWPIRASGAVRIEASLAALSERLANTGVQRLTERSDEPSLAQLSKYVAEHAAALSQFVATAVGLRDRRSMLTGILFTPLFKHNPAAANTSQPTWQAIAAHSRTVPGRHVGFSISRIAAWSVVALAAIWIAGTLTSVATNRGAIKTAEITIAKLSAPNNPTQAALNLYSLQQQIGTLEARQRDGAPWYSRFGLNHDVALLNSVWPSYEAASRRVLIQPITTKLEVGLQQLGSLTDQELANSGDAQVKAAYSTLKSYLMLSQPQHADSSFLVPQLLTTGQPVRPESSSITASNWRDLTKRLITFHANHLRQRPSLAITPDVSLIATARQTLVSVMGLQNSTDAVYQQILDETRAKYPPVSLQTLMGDTSSRGLFASGETLSGVYTRQAWDERIGKAIDDADAERTITGDWVLSDTPATNAMTSKTSLKDELRQRYFADYGRAWQRLLNSVHWQADTSLSGTVDQLSLYADPQRSPLSALFKVIVYQAGTGAMAQSLSDTLVSKARLLVSGDNKDKNPANATVQPEAPLASAFGPLLRVAGSDLATYGPTKSVSTQTTNTSDISLSRYLERVTGVRLKLQQIMMSPDPDAMSRTAAQAILQGKTSDIGDSRDYASRVAASLGEQWSGFGNAVFQRPFDQTWDVVLQPAAASLNETWRTAVVAAWNKSFGGRYPFVDSDSDASLPEMARFLRADGGVISQFVSTQLGGIIERQGDQWVVMQAAGRNSLRVDPEFVSALNRLTRVSNVLFPTGDANLRYELRAIPTPGITDVKIALSGRDLHYFNQREEWTPFVWPGEALENGTRIEWKTEQAGPRVAFDYAGRFGLIRLLERATVSQQDGARYWLRWPLGKEAIGVAPEAMPTEAVEAAAPQRRAPAAPKHTALLEIDDWTAQTAASPAPPQADWKPDRSNVAKPSPQPLRPTKPRFLQVQLRSEVGAGPLDVLKLRNFTLPSRIFLRSDAAGRAVNPGANPPPLPAAALDAAKHAATPLPRGALPVLD
jgi:type VI secretion system protein ImpL